MRDSAGEWPSRANAAWFHVFEDSRGWHVLVTAVGVRRGRGGAEESVGSSVCSSRVSRVFYC
jgi:hypothetical protein